MGNDPESGSSIREHSRSTNAADDGSGNSTHTDAAAHQSASVQIRETTESLSRSLNGLIDVLVEELRHRWNSGQTPVIEELGDRYHVVAGNEEQLLDLIYHEVLIREEHGQKCVVDDFIPRFPAHEDRLRRLFAVHGAIEDDWSDEMSEESPDDFDSAVFSGSAPNHQRSEHTPDSVPALSNTEQEPSGSKSPDGGSRDSGGRRTPLWPRRSREQQKVEPPPGYELQGEVGRGGMAVVYRARQQILNRTVALKMLLSGGLAGPETLARIRQEALAVAQLQHPGIVQIYEVGEHRGLPFLALEYVAGGTLHEWLDGQPLEPMEACRIVEQLAEIVQFAHHKGIVHRDLKPANILLIERPDSLSLTRTIVMEGSRSGSQPQHRFSVKISDFGLARVLDHGSSLTVTGQIIGTPGYMAPEQAAGATEQADPAQDVYSLGAILYELLTGRPPFRGATLFDTLEQVRSDDPVPPTRLQPRVPADLETVCLKCLEKLPARRYATAGRLAEELRAVLDGRPILARPSGWIERVWKWSRRAPGTAALFVTMGFLVIAVLVGVIVESRLSAVREIEAQQERDRAIILRNTAEEQRQLAEENAERALRMTQLAEQQRIQAEASRSDAIIARQQAEASLQQAMAAVDSLARLGMELRRTPMQQSTSRRILDETLKLYTQLETTHGESQQLRLQLAAALIRAGEIRSALRENEKAAELLARGVTLIDSELQRNPDDIPTLKTASYGRWVYGVFLNSIERWSDASEAFRSSVAAHDAVLTMRPGDIEHLNLKANALTNLCVSLLRQERLPESLEIYEEAIQTLRTVQQRVPQDRVSASELALALHDYSRVLRPLRGHAPAEAAFEEALEIRRRLHVSRPDDSENRSLYSRLFVSRGILLRQSGDYEESLKQFRQAAELLEPLVNQFPELYEHHRDLTVSLIFELETCLQAGDEVNGRLRWDELAERLVAARKRFPQEPQVVMRMQEWLAPWCDHLREAGRTAQADDYRAQLVNASVWLTSLPTDGQVRLSDEEAAVAARNTALYLSLFPGSNPEECVRAEALARKSMQLTGDHITSRLALGAALLGQRRTEEAAGVLQEGIESDRGTDNNQSLQNAGAILNAFGRVSPLAVRDAARAVFGLGSSSEERQPEIHLLWAIAQCELGNADVAASAFSRIPTPSDDWTVSGPRLRRLYRLAAEKISSGTP